MDAQLIVSFDDQTESFTLGFEAGVIWKRMMDGEAKIEGNNGFLCHFANKIVFERMAASQQYEMTFEYIDHHEEWFMPVFIKVRHKFAVVDGGLQ